MLYVTGKRSNEVSDIASLEVFLPLGFLPFLECFQNFDLVLQSCKPGLQAVIRLRRFGSKLCEEVLAVGGGGHGSIENGLDQEAVVRLEGVSVRGTERVGQFLGGCADVLAEGLGGEIETTKCRLLLVNAAQRKNPKFLAGWRCGAEDLPDKPNETFGSSVLFRLQLVENKSLECFRLGGSCSLAITEFLIKHAIYQPGEFHRRDSESTNLDIAQNIILDRCESNGTESV